MSVVDIKWSLMCTVVHDYNVIRNELHVTWLPADVATGGAVHLFIAGGGRIGSDNHWVGIDIDLDFIGVDEEFCVGGGKGGRVEGREGEV